MSPRSQEDRAHRSSEDEKLTLQDISTRTAAEWRKMMFRDESTFILRGFPKMVRRPSTTSRNVPKFTVKIVKYTGSVMKGFF